MQNKSGFTMIEMLFVMSIVLILSVFSFSYTGTIQIEKDDDYVIKSISRIIDHGKNQSILSGQRQTIEFKTYSMSCNEEQFILPDGYYFTNIQSVSFNGEGNIRQACHIDMYTPERQYKLVFHLGGGHYEFQS